MCWWAETAVLIGDRDAAVELRHLLEPLAGRMVDIGPAVLDTVDRFRALLLMQLDDVEAALEVAHRTVEASRRRRTDLFLGRELIVLAAARRRAGDADESDRALQEGLAIAERTGAHVITGDARLLLGIEPRRAQLANGSALTRREREVLDLVRAGLTNAQVARALGISPATVRKHLEHAFHKLDVSTRTAAVARAGADDGARLPISGPAGT
ncbi:MAG: response regulator transcription factor [Ilumatobacteraceae bacterium]